MPRFADFVTPSSLWSLWVPVALLLLIGLAAVYFARLSR